jgi:hypothetical protein
MAGGNEYTAAVVSTTEDTAAIIIREVYQHPAQVGRLSFPAKEFKSPRPYISDRVTKHEHEPELEYEEEPEALEEEPEAVEEETGYTIVGVEGKELAAEESTSGQKGADNE